MEQILGLLSGGIGGAALVWFLRGWITERLKQSIHHEYAEKLESYRTELNAKIQDIQHRYQINQLRTSLFFDHQRDAYASLLAKISEVNKKWFESYQPDEGLLEPAPSDSWSELKNLFNKHQLFLDEDGVMAVELIIESYSDSFPFDDGLGGVAHRDIRLAYSHVEYIQPRLATIFREKIGVASKGMALQEVALLGAMKIINSYHFSAVELPPKGRLKIKGEQPGDVVAKAKENREELISKLKEFEVYLFNEGGFFPEALLALRRYIAVLCHENA